MFLKVPCLFQVPTYYYTGQYFDAFYGLNKERESIQTRGLLPSTSPSLKICYPKDICLKALFLLILSTWWKKSISMQTKVG